MQVETIATSEASNLIATKKEPPISLFSLSKEIETSLEKKETTFTDQMVGLV